MGRHVCFQHLFLVLVFQLVLQNYGILGESHSDSHESESILEKPGSSISPPLSSAEIGLNSSENIQHDYSASYEHAEEDPLLVESSTRIERREKSPSAAGDGESEINWQFRKMPDNEDNYHETDADYDNDPTTEQYGEAMRPSIPQPSVYYPPAQDRFITRHSTKIKLPNYTPIFHYNKIIPHGPKKHRGRGGGHPPVHHVQHHGHGHGHDPYGHSASSSMQKYVPSYISYGPILGQPPPHMGSQSIPVYVPTASPPNPYHVSGHFSAAAPSFQHFAPTQASHHFAPAPTHGHVPMRAHAPTHGYTPMRAQAPTHGYAPMRAQAPTHGHAPMRAAQAPTHAPYRGRNQRRGQHMASHSHNNHWTVLPSVGPVGSAPPLPPFMGGPPTHLGSPMAAIYIPPSPTPIPVPVPTRNRYPAALPYENDVDEDYYYEERPPPKNTYLPPKNSWKPPSSSRSRKRKPYSTLYNPSSKPFATQSEPVYTPVPSGHRDKPSTQYQKPGKSMYGPPPMNFGQPMHNFGPPMSSYGQPPPIMGEVPTSIYEPTDEMYKYKNDPPQTGSGTNFPRNKYGGTRYHHFHSAEAPYDGGYKGDSSEANHFHYRDQGNEVVNSKPYEHTSPSRQPSHKIRINPNKRFRSPPPGDGGGGFGDTSADYSPQPPDGPGSRSMYNGNGNDRPHPNYDTRYNSPGLSKDPKIVDWMPYSAKEYRELRDRQRKHRSKKERYSTLPDSIQAHTPDPDHENYPKLTYDAIKKRVMALADLQTSSSNLKKHLEEQKELQRINSSSSKSED